MLQNCILPVLAVLGFLTAGTVSVVKERSPAPAEPYSWPPAPPFKHFIAGAGLIEGGDGNIEIGTQVPGVVRTRYVREGDRVREGDLLFDLDDRLQQAAKEVAVAQMERVLRELERAQVAPRPEEKVVAQQEAEEAYANYEEAAARLERVRGLRDPSVLSEQERDAARLRAEALRAAAEAAQQRATMAEVGTWERDLAVLEAELAVAEAQLEEAMVQLAYTRVRAPMDGLILERGVQPGSYVTGATGMRIGEVDVLRCRVDIDEVDAWRVNPRLPTLAFLRGNAHVAIELELEYIDPYVRPKRSLTLENDERIDTRVLQILYRFRPDEVSVPVYVGQLVDVFIAAEEDTYHRAPPIRIEAGASPELRAGHGS